MSRSTVILTLSLAAFIQALTQFAAAQQATSPTPTAEPQDRSWYYGPTTPTPPDRKSFSQQKARMRAEQRIARLESYRHYGITPNRPTAEAMPVTSAYPLMWLRRGTTPIVTYNSNRPLMYYAYPYTVYR
jgi:hypothetical protein